MSFFDELNLSDASTLLTSHPSVVLYGPPGLGKSTLMARLFPGTVDGPAVLYVLSAAEVIRPLASWFQENAEYARENKLRTLYAENPAWTPEKGKSTKGVPAYLDGSWGTPTVPRSPTKGGIPIKIIPAASKDVSTGDCALVRVYANAVALGNKMLLEDDAPISGIVWDEMSVFMRRFTAEIAAARPEIFLIPFLFPGLQNLDAVTLAGETAKTAESLKKNVWGVQQQLLARFFDWFAALGQTTGAFFGQIYQRAETRFFTAEDEAVKRGKKKLGDVRSLEGPDAPSEKIRTAICSNASVVLGGRIENGRRIWRTASSELSHAKFRSFGIPDSIDADEVCWAFYRAGYSVPRPAGDAPEWF